jgi:hypothetical protein
MHGCRKEERTNAVDSFSCPVTDFPQFIAAAGRHYPKRRRREEEEKIQ